MEGFDSSFIFPVEPLPRNSSERMSRGHDVGAVGMRSVDQMTTVPNSIEELSSVLASYPDVAQFGRVIVSIALASALGAAAVRSGAPSPAELKILAATLRLGSVVG